MTTGAYLILFIFGVLMILIGHLDRRAKRDISSEEGEVIGFFAQVAEKLARNAPDRELQAKMGIIQRKN